MMTGHGSVIQCNTTPIVSRIKNDCMDNTTSSFLISDVPGFDDAYKS
jgi:hypothetical protein